MPSPTAARLLSLLVPSFCWACAADARTGQPLCPDCRAALPRLAAEPVALGAVEVWAPLAYEGPAAALVRGLKYRGAVGLAGPMAAQIAANLPPPAFGAPESAGAHPAALVPVPLHPRRRRRRGYNQAERLAAALARRTGLEVRDCLVRGGDAGRQVGHGRQDRLAALAGAVSLRPRARPPARAVLVDDVATTGATLAACAAALKAAGARQVTAVAFARTLGR